VCISYQGGEGYEKKGPGEEQGSDEEKNERRVIDLIFPIV